MRSRAESKLQRTDRRCHRRHWKLRRGPSPAITGHGKVTRIPPGSRPLANRNGANWWSLKNAWLRTIHDPPEGTRLPSSNLSFGDPQSLERSPVYAYGWPRNSVGVTPVADRKARVKALWS